MNDTPSLQQLNRTFIGSVLFLDIVDYSQQTVHDQHAMKEAFIELLIAALEHVAAGERIMVDTGDGAGIAFLADPEDALFTALSLRDAIEAGKGPQLGVPGFVRMGINLGPLKIVRDVNGHTNMIGDGVNDAQRVMSFAEPGQVKVSHSYYDIVSRFSHDYTKLFVYEGTRHDKHVREHEIYRLGAAEEAEKMTEKMRDRSRARHSEASAHAALPARKEPRFAIIKTISQGRLIAAVGAVTVIAASAGYWLAAPAAPAPQAPAIAAIAATSSVTLPASAPAASSAAASTTASTTASGTVPVASPVAGSTPPAAAAGTGSAPAQASIAAANARINESTNATISATSPALVASTAPTLASAGPTASVPDASSAASTASKNMKKGVEKGGEKTTPPVTTAKNGTLTLTIEPWGEIFVDGSARGFSPPLKSLNLAAGKHQIVVRNSNFAPYKQTIEVKSGAATNVHTTF